MREVKGGVAARPERRLERQARAGGRAGREGCDSRVDVSRGMGAGRLGLRSVVLAGAASGEDPGALPRSWPRARSALAGPLAGDISSTRVLAVARPSLTSPERLPAADWPRRTPLAFGPGSGARRACPPRWPCLAVASLRAGVGSGPEDSRQGARGGAASWRGLWHPSQASAAPRLRPACPLCRAPESHPDPRSGRPGSRPPRPAGPMRREARVVPAGWAAVLADRPAHGSPRIPDASSLARLPQGRARPSARWMRGRCPTQTSAARCSARGLT